MHYCLFCFTLFVCLFVCLFVLLLFVLLIDHPGHLPQPWFVGFKHLDLGKVKEEALHLSLKTLQSYKYWDAASTQDVIFGKLLVRCFVLFN